MGDDGGYALFKANEKIDRLKSMVRAHYDFILELEAKLKAVEAELKAQLKYKQDRWDAAVRAAEREEERAEKAEAKLKAVEQELKMYKQKYPHFYKAEIAEFNRQEALKES